MIYTEFVIRISLSMLLGFLIGLERQLTGHPAGIRINVLIWHRNQFLYAVSYALWFRSGVPCGKQHYIRCRLSVQRCDF